MHFSRILIVTPSGIGLPVDIAGATVLQRPADIASADPEDFLDRLRTWLSTAEQEYAPTLTDEPNRLLQAGEYRAAVIAAITLLESTLTDRYKKAALSFSRPTPLRALLEMAQAEGWLGNIPFRTVQGWLAIRNQTVHTDRPVSRPEATEIVRGVSQIISRP
jgi:hypothetical protein